MFRFILLKQKKLKRIMKFIFSILSLFMFFQTNAQKLNAQVIIDEAIKKHGGDNYNNAHFAYDFRKNHFEYHYDNGVFRYELHSKDGKTKDILTNEGFKRLVNGEELQLPDKKRKAYSNTVNSVHYFVFLPSFLNDAAVNKKLIGETTIKGKEYYKIRVTFDEEGGGYSFLVNGGGVRFRSAFNKRMIGGILFQDYVNFKHDKDTPVEELDALFNENKLIQVSQIETENIVKI